MMPAETGVAGGWPSPAVRPYRFFAEMTSFALHFQPTRVMNRAPTKRKKGFTTMTNAEATITENAATVAAQSAHVAPEKTSRRRGPARRRATPYSATMAALSAIVVTAFLQGAVCSA
jgi:hypothetical protein